MPSFVLPKSETGKQLQNLNYDYFGRQAWEQRFGQVDLSKQKATSAVTYDYAKEVGEAYANSLASEQAILNSNYGTTIKEQAIQSNEQALQEAYESYKQNYLNNLSTVDKTYEKPLQSVQDELSLQAENTTKLHSSAYEYLQYLYKNYKDTDLFKSENWSKYLNAEGELKTWEQLSIGDAVKEGEISNAFFDKDGNLTIAGADFYDQMMNEISQGKYGNTYTSYDAWLAETNPELSEWARTYNPYDYQAYVDAQGNIVNSNLGSFRTLVGMTSNDETYAFIERYGGMSEKQIDNMFNELTQSINNVNDSKTWDLLDKTDNETYKNKLNKVTENIKTLAKDLGIEQELGNAIGGWDKLTTAMDDFVNQANHEKDMLAFEYLGKKSATTGIGLGSTTLLAFVPVVGPALAIIAGTATVTANAVQTAEYVANRELIESKYNQKMKDAYMAMVSSMVTFAKSERRQKEIEFNNKNK